MLGIRSVGEREEEGHLDAGWPSRTAEALVYVALLWLALLRESQWALRMHWSSVGAWAAIRAKLAQRTKAQGGACWSWETKEAKVGAQGRRNPGCSAQLLTQRQMALLGPLNFALVACARRVGGPL
jgi:hypothetical protein